MTPSAALEQVLVDMPANKWLSVVRRMDWYVRLGRECDLPDVIRLYHPGSMLREDWAALRGSVKLKRRAKRAQRAKGRRDYMRNYMRDRRNCG